MAFYVSNGSGKHGTQKAAAASPGTSRLVLSRQQEYQIGRILEGAVEPTGNGKVRYKEGWDDERIAREAQAIAPVNIHHIIRLRKQIFGDLKPKHCGQSPLSVLHNRVTDLLARVEALEAAVTNPNK